MSKPVTPSDLKTFIEAVEFAADQENWVPTPRQWSKIRDMINNLVESPPEYSRQPQQYAPSTAPAMSFPPVGEHTMAAPQLPQHPPIQQNWSMPTAPMASSLLNHQPMQGEGTGYKTPFA